MTHNDDLVVLEAEETIEKKRDFPCVVPRACHFMPSRAESLTRIVYASMHDRDSAILLKDGSAGFSKS